MDTLSDGELRGFRVTVRQLGGLASPTPDLAAHSEQFRRKEAQLAKPTLHSATAAKLHTVESKLSEQDRKLQLTQDNLELWRNKVKEAQALLSTEEETRDKI